MRNLQYALIAASLPFCVACTTSHAVKNTPKHLRPNQVAHAERDEAELQNYYGQFYKKDIGNGLHVARFAANANVSPEIAEGLAQLGAIETCYEQGGDDEQLAVIYGSLNVSQQTEVTRTSGSSFRLPSFSSGSMSINQLGNSLFVNGQQSVSHGLALSNSTSWQETTVFPAFDIFFACANKASALSASLQMLETSVATPFTKDPMGALLVRFTRDLNSSRPTLLKTGDVIINVNGSRVHDFHTLSLELNRSKGKANLRVSRNGTILNLLEPVHDRKKAHVDINFATMTSACSLRGISSRPICSSGLQNLIANSVTTVRNPSNTAVDTSKE